MIHVFMANVNEFALWSPEGWGVNGRDSKAINSLQVRQCFPNFPAVCYVTLGAYEWVFPLTDPR